MSKAISIRLPDQLLEDARTLAKKEGVTVTNLIIAGLHEQVNSQKAECKDMPALKIKAVKMPGEAVKEPEPIKPVIIKGKADIDVDALRAAHKAKHPNDICMKCQRFNKECKC